MPKVAKNCTNLPKNAKNCTKLLKVAQSCQKLPKVAKNCTKLPKVVKSCAKLPKVAQSCQNLCKEFQFHLHLHLHLQFRTLKAISGWMGQDLSHTDSNTRAPGGANKKQDLIETHPMGVCRKCGEQFEMGGSE